MKIRARLGPTVKVVEIEDDVAPFVQLRNTDPHPTCVWKSFESVSEKLLLKFEMGLNKTDLFKNEDATIKDCGIVHCDLIHIITENPIPVIEAKKIKVQEKKGVDTNNKGKSMSSCLKDATSSKSVEPMAFVCNSPYMKKVLLCHESTSERVPEQLEMLLHSSSAETSQEILMVAVHQLMRETGFQFATNVTVDGSSSPIMSNLSEIFANQRNQSYYRLFYTLPDNERVTAMLVCIPMIKMLIIQGKLLNHPPSEENAPEYLMNSEHFINQMKTDSAATVYKNLRSLSAEFKDNVALPLLGEMKIALGIPDDSGFLGLIPEIQFKIFKYLDVRTLLSVSLVCKSLYEKSRDPSLWRRLFTIHNKSSFACGSSDDWFNNFKKMYVSTMERPRYSKFLQSHSIR